jgi:hypothetical protein
VITLNIVLVQDLLRHHRWALRLTMYSDQMALVWFFTTPGEEECLCLFHLHAFTSSDLFSTILPRPMSRTLLSLVRNSRSLFRHSRNMSSHSAPLLLSPSQVRDLPESISLLDASWFMPNSPRKPYEEFLAKRIPGAQFLDLDHVASAHELGLKHMMPQSQVFAAACGMTVGSDLCRVLTRAPPRNIRY